MYVNSYDKQQHNGRKRHNIKQFLFMHTNDLYSLKCVTSLYVSWYTDEASGWMV